MLKAKDQGMFVIAFDTDLEYDDAYFGLDNVEIGVPSLGMLLSIGNLPEGERVEVGYS